jgi:hypothetical protein
MNYLSDQMLGMSVTRKTTSESLRTAPVSINASATASAKAPDTPSPLVTRNRAAFYLVSADAMSHGKEKVYGSIP